MGKIKTIETVALNVRVPKKQVAAMDKLIIKIDDYRSRSDVVREAIGDLLTKKATDTSSCSSASEV